MADPMALQELRRRLETELTARGCPAESARSLATEVWHGPGLSITADPAAYDVFWVWWRGTGIGLQSIDDPDEVAVAVESLVDGIVDENAEAHDRAVRGEPVEPLWPLPERRPRT